MDLINKAYHIGLARGENNGKALSKHGATGFARGSSSYTMEIFKELKSLPEEGHQRSRPTNDHHATPGIGTILLIFGGICFVFLIGLGGFCCFWYWLTSNNR